MPQKDMILQDLSTGDDDMQILQRILEGAPDYSRRVNGLPVAPHAAMDEMFAYPDDVSPEQVFAFRIMVKGEAIGTVHMLRGYPDANTAMIGLLLLMESHQGKGFGKLAWRSVEERCRQWPECEKIRIGVLTTNDIVLPFWHSCGFRETGTRVKYHEGLVDGEIIVLDKILHRSESTESSCGELG